LIFICNVRIGHALLGRFRSAALGSQYRGSRQGVRVVDDRVDALFLCLREISPVCV